MGFNVTVVHTESSVGWGGQELRIINECEGLLERGYRVIIACNYGSSIYADARDRGLQVRPVLIEKKRIRDLLSVLLFLWSIKDVKVVNTHSSTDSWLVAIASKIIRPKVSYKLIRTRHVSTKIKASHLNGWLYRSAVDGVITTGESIKNKIIGQFGLNEDKVVSITTGVDVKRFIPKDKKKAKEGLGLDLGKKYLGIVATLRDWKGHNFLLKAFEGLAKENKELHMLIIGDGPQRENIKKLIREYGLGERVTMVGNQKNVENWLNALDIFVLPSYAEEGVSQSVMQAMSVGLPVVVTDVGSMSELVKDRVTGLICKIKSPLSIQLAVREVIRDATLRQRLAHNSSEVIRTERTDKIMLDKIEEFYRGLL